MFLFNVFTNYPVLYNKAISIFGAIVLTGHCIMNYSYLIYNSIVDI